jgi:hypothetical protein
VSRSHLRSRDSAQDPPQDRSTGAWAFLRRLERRHGGHVVGWIAAGVGVGAGRRCRGSGSRSAIGGGSRLSGRISCRSSGDALAPSLTPSAPRNHLHSARHRQQPPPVANSRLPLYPHRLRNSSIGEGGSSSLGSATIVSSLSSAEFLVGDGNGDVFSGVYAIPFFFQNFPFLSTWIFLLPYLRYDHYFSFLSVSLCFVSDPLRSQSSSPRPLPGRLRSRCPRHVATAVHGSLLDGYLHVPD